jgi:hypothetical protein
MTYFLQAPREKARLPWLSPRKRQRRVHRPPVPLLVPRRTWQPGSATSVSGASDR